MIATKVSYRRKSVFRLTFIQILRETELYLMLLNVP